MKIRVRCILPMFLVLLFAYSPTNLFAQSEQCDDCPLSEWTYSAATFQINPPGGCKFNADYRYRVSLCGQFDIEIIGISEWNLACTRPLDPGRMVNAALVLLLTDPVKNFPQLEIGQCERTVRGHVSQCLGLQPDGSLRQCGPNICCTKTFEVCMDTSGNRHVNLISVSNPSPLLCGSIDSSGNCYPACDEGGW